MEYIILFIFGSALLYAAWSTYKKEGLMGAIIVIIFMAAIISNFK